MTHQQPEKYLWGATTLLRATIVAGDNKQYIFPLRLFKRIYDGYKAEFERALAESDDDMEYASSAKAKAAAKSVMHCYIYTKTHFNLSTHHESPLSCHRSPAWCHSSAWIC